MTTKTVNPDGSSPTEEILDPTALADEVIAALGEDFTIEPHEDEPAPAEPPAPKAEDPPAPAPEPATPPAPKPAAPKAGEGEPPALELPTVPHPYDLADDPTLADLPDVKEATGQRFDVMRQRLREAREAAQFGHGIIQHAANGKLQANDVADLVVLTSLARQGNAQAQTTLHGLLTRLGVAPTAPAPAPPVSLPSVEDRARQIYTEVFAGKVKSLDVDEETAQGLARAAAEREIKNAPAPTPLPAAPPAAPALSQPHTPPQDSQQDPVVLAATEELGRLETQFKAAYAKAGLDFAPIEAEVDKRIREMPRQSPIKWAYTYTRLVREVQTERAAAAKPPKPKAPAKTGNDSLRPSSKGSAIKPGTDAHRESMVEAIMGGDLDNLPG